MKFMVNSMENMQEISGILLSSANVLSSPSLGFAGGKSFLATIHFGDTGLNLVECADW